MERDYAIACYPWVDGCQYEATLIFHYHIPEEEATKWAEDMVKGIRIKNPNLSVEEAIKRLKTSYGEKK